MIKSIAVEKDSYLMVGSNGDYTLLRTIDYLPVHRGNERSCHEFNMKVFKKKRKEKRNGKN